MKRQKSEPVFKAHVMNQMNLMPQRYDEKIPAGHLVRLVKEAIEALDLEILAGIAFMILRYFLLSFFSFNPAFAGLVTKRHLCYRPGGYSRKII